MNYQYRHGSSFPTATKTLYVEGGMRRYYQGISAALVQGKYSNLLRNLDRLYKTNLFKGPVSRFGDTAANAGILALLQSNSYLNRMPTLVQTIFASLW
jgi:hypothetical protein